ncbi:MAG: sigma 54-interacting transcriptional regulator [Gammaproteobacteria bacterium]|nr:sigma 54-interacting transcriptional regulator [Gammaproteobacteria bacterium]
MNNAMSPDRADTLARLQRQNELILGAAGEGIYGVDCDGYTTFVNPAAAKMLGYSSDELIGQPMHSLLHHTKPDGSHYPREECPIYAAFKDGKVHRIYDEVFWRKDGSSFPVEYSSTPITQDGELEGAVVVFWDISERKSAEKELQDALTEVNALKERLQTENVYLQEEIKTEHNFSEIIGNSGPLQKLLRKIEQVAPTDATVLIQGETGTGKELIARAIHDRSERKDRPLVKVNCGAITEGLIESELFGHEKGSFTGAVQQRAGRFEVANGGTIFLDEVGELPMEAQVRLLRVLQEQEFERVGSSRAIKVDVRVIAATNRDLAEMVKEDKFRMDLYYRLNVFPVEVPSLSERADDIPLLVDYFIARLAKRYPKQIEGFSPECITYLSNYPWPGNVRELENVIERAAILSDGPVLSISESLKPITHKKSISNGNNTLEEVERGHILAVLDKTNGVITGNSGAAKILGLNPSTLRSRMQKLGIKRSTVTG